MFESLQRGPADPMYNLKKKADSDRSPEKVDLGVGIYRNELGNYHEFRCIKYAKKLLSLNNPGHDYELTTGNTAFLDNASKIVFGSECEVRKSGKITSVQAISGTGANHLGALLVSRSCENRPAVYVGTPTWGNYDPLFRLVGLGVQHYTFYDSERQRVDFESCIKAVQEVPRGSVFVLQGCCHNPTGADFDANQWHILADEMRSAGHLPFFDIAYQGLGDGVNEDAYGVRLFTSMGFEMVVCQSFSKNFGLYGERVGVLHIVNRDACAAANVHDQLRSLIRWEFSSSPAFGSRLVNIVLDDRNWTIDWSQELCEIRERLKQNRTHLHDLLSRVFQTPGDWSHILREKGLFSYFNLTASQCNALTFKHHIYLPTSGRINIAGLNEDCIKRVAAAIDAVLREDRSRNAVSDNAGDVDCENLQERVVALI